MFFFKKKKDEEQSKETKVENKPEKTSQNTPQDTQKDKPENKAKPKKKGFFARLKSGLKKTREKVATQLKKVFSLGRKVDDELLEEIFEILISADMGVEITEAIIEDLQKAYKDKVLENKDSEALYQYIKNQLQSHLTRQPNELNLAKNKPTVILVAGVNGSGKTTSIAKLAHLFCQQGKKVMLAAGDTFRAAAVEQLDIWSKRIGADIVKQGTGADPAAVAYDALEAALARGHDIVIVDTAGRLHTQDNLMKQLEKIFRVITKKVPGAPHEVLLVLDATTGQNALIQAQEFKSLIKVTGLFLAKLDGTAKGGIVVAINNKIDIPVKFIGLGETPEDIEVFDAEKFVEALFE